MKLKLLHYTQYGTTLSMAVEGQKRVSKEAEHYNISKIHLNPPESDYSTDYSTS